jgi:hypothetical protein
MMPIAASVVVAKDLSDDDRSSLFDAWKRRRGVAASARAAAARQRREHSDRALRSGFRALLDECVASGEIGLTATWKEAKAIIENDNNNGGGGALVDRRYTELVARSADTIAAAAVAVAAAKAKVVGDDRKGKSDKNDGNGDGGDDTEAAAATRLSQSMKPRRLYLAYMDERDLEVGIDHRT